MDQNSKKLLTNSRGAKVATELNDQLDSCDEFVISVAFITLGGVTCILESLRKLHLRGIKGRVLTGSYLNFTEPKALMKLLEFDNIELKMIDGENFHAKGFFFRKKNLWNLIIGSSNLTQSALTINNEWNLLFEANDYDEITKQVLSEFDSLFKSANNVDAILDQYIAIYENSRKVGFFEKQHHLEILPNQVQREAIENLEYLRLSGATKALIVSATGTGKTFLSAFDVARVRPKRCLFIVHRANIALRAKETFSKIIEAKSLGLFTGEVKSTSDYLFATVQTLKNQENLEKFSVKEFDYIIIDEVHHAEAKTYKKVLSYFKPKFLLGITATPERNDDADIFKLFDYNVAYEIRLHQALEQGFLCPFHYFAIEDFYTESEKSLAKNFSKLVSDSRVDHIVNKMKFYGYSGQHRSTLMFVSGVDEAYEISSKLNARGIRAKALTSLDNEVVRGQAIIDLEANILEVIVTVDVFNEGIDIPCLNQIILLRPTQSAIIYIQQLGRGLRKHKNKKFVVILDFIANYENNFLIPVALSQNNSYDKDELKKFLISPNNYIAGKSTVTFCSVAKEIIYKNIQKTNFSQFKNIKKDYKQLKKELGRVPYLSDFQKYNFVSPEIVLSAKDTYYDILIALKEEIPILDSRQYNVLKFISKEFTPSKRLYEILILEHLLKSRSIEISELILKLKKSIGFFDKDSFYNALEHLSLNIFTVNAGRKSYENLINIRQDVVSLVVFELIHESEFLYYQIRDLIEYNKAIYISKYCQNSLDQFVMYAKYTKKDIAHLFNQDYTNGGINLAGYRVFGNIALLFMTFGENIKSSLHDNIFISDRVFTYYSKARKTLNDYIERSLAENKYNSLVFARINKSDSYFYLGRVSKCLDSEEVFKQHKMVKYSFELERSLSKEMWHYFKVINKSKNTGVIK